MRNYFYVVMATIIGFAATSLFSSDSSDLKVLNLTPSNTVLIRGEVSPLSVTQAMLDISRLVVERGESDYPIYLVLDSPGGSVLHGEMLINYLSTIPNIHSVTIFSASMAQHIAQSVAGKRYVTISGTFMDHRASGQFRGQFGEGEVESRLAWIKAIVKVVSERTAARLGISLEEYNAKIVNEWWNVGSDALNSGHADEVVTIVCDQALIDSRVSSTVFTIFGPESQIFSGCPLFGEPIPVPSAP